MANEKLVSGQFTELVSKFSKLALVKREDSQWEISGKLGFTGIYDGKCIEDEFAILMVIPKDYPNDLIQVWETGDRIPPDFHKYTNGALCLGAPLAIKATFNEDPTLRGFVHNCLIPYLYSFSYYLEFGVLPFGELSHGIKGIFEYYKELFHVKEDRAVLRLIKILASDSYRGHLPCACGSGKRLRACHGPTLLKSNNLQSSIDFQTEYDLLHTGLLNFR